MTDEHDQYDTLEEFGDIVEASDLLIGFQWHDEGGHWHPAAFSYPETFTEDQIEQLEQISNEFAERLSAAGLSIPMETE